MKITVLGSRGMAGHVITRYLREQGHEVLAVARSNSDFDLDIEKTEDVRRFFDHHPFEVLEREKVKQKLNQEQKVDADADEEPQV